MTETGLWYVAIRGQQQGPMPAQMVYQLIHAGHVDRTAYVYGMGMSDWVPILSVGQFAGALQPVDMPPPPPPPATPAPSADEIDYEILGDESRFVEITLDPGEACVADAGTLFYMEAGIELATVLPDGAPLGEPSPFMAKLLRGLRPVGDPLFLSVFANSASERRRVAFASFTAGSIVPLDLRELGGTLVVQRDAFLCAAKGIVVELVEQKQPGPGQFSPDGFILHKIQGEGLAFLHAGGAVVPRDLQDGETVRVEAGCLIALEPRVVHEIDVAPGVRSTLAGGDSLLLATVAGPGRVWLQSLPPSRVAGKTLSAGGVA